MSDRRAARRLETIDEVVETALAVMAESGAAALTLGEVAKRMGIRTPSLYGYFESKAALCDEIFARGWREIAAVMAPLYAALPHRPDLAATMLDHLRVFVGWALEHRAQAELMFWRPIPAWEPTPEAYAPAVDLVDTLHRALRTVQQRGRLRPDATPEEMGRVLTVLSTGVISQQLSNEPGVPLQRGRFASDLGRLVAMFIHEFGTEEAP